MKRFTGLLFFLLFLFSYSSAQELEGVIIDAETSEVLSYVNIGLLGKDIGTVSDQDGAFSLKIPTIHLNDTLRFSMIGYKTYDVYPKDLLDADSNIQIKLQPKGYELNEVVVIPKDYEATRFGNKADGKNISAGFSENLLGYEVGVLMKLKKKRQGYLEKVMVNIANCEYDSVFFRLNIYEMDGKKPGENILDKPIYLSYTKEELLENIEIDLSKEVIFVKGNFLVTLELVKDLGEGGLNFCTGFFQSPIYYRETSQGRWQKSGFIAIGMSAIVLVEKD